MLETKYDIEESFIHVSTRIIKLEFDIIITFV